MAITVRFAGSEEEIAAPTEMTEEQAARWALRLYHDSADRHVRQIRPGVWEGSNGRRGVSKRGTVVTVTKS